MKPRSLMSFFNAFLVGAFIFLVIGLLILFISFDLGGGETLQQIEAQRMGWLLITLLLAIAAGFIAREYLKNGKRYTPYGIRIVTLICVIGAAIHYSKNLMVTPFNKTTWQHAEYKPFNMSASLVKRKKLIGLTREQVKNMLGAGADEREDKTAGDGYIKYWVKESWSLTVYFQNGKVIETELRLPWLGV